MSPSLLSFGTPKDKSLTLRGEEGTDKEPITGESYLCKADAVSVPALAR